MERATHIPRGAKTSPLLAGALLLLGAASHGQSEQPAVRLELTKPEPGAVYTMDLDVWGQLMAPAGREYELKLRCFETTHWFLFSPREPHAPEPDANGEVKWRLNDSYLLPQKGEQVLEISVFELRGGPSTDDATAVAELRVPFRFEPATEAELTEKLEQCSSMVCGGAGGLAGHWPDPHYHVGTWKKPITQTEPMVHDVRYYLGARRRELVQRSDAYAEAARVLDGCGRDGDALRALRTAQEIYDAERGRLLSGPGFQGWSIIWEPGYVCWPPRYFSEYSRYYARRKDLDKAIAWEKENAASYLLQAERHPLLSADNRDKCHRDAARSYLNIARMSYLLKRDRAGREAWIRKYLQTLPASERASAGVDLLDTGR
jgi:hypothetical protein